MKRILLPVLDSEVEGVDDNLSNLESDSYKNMILNVVKSYPNFKALAPHSER